MLAVIPAVVKLLRLYGSMSGEEYESKPCESVYIRQPMSIGESSAAMAPLSANAAKVSVLLVI